MRFICIIFLVSITFSCAKKTNITEPALARVGSNYLTIEEAKANIPLTSFNNDSIAALINYRDEWIKRQLVLDEAVRLKLTAQPEVQKRLKTIREDYLQKVTESFLMGEIDEELTVTDDEARLFYQQNKKNFELEERYVRYRHLIAATYENALKSKEELLQGYPWEDVAKKYSINPELTIRESEQFWPISIAGGDVAVLNRYLRVIGINEISAIENVGGKFHFVQLIDAREKGDHSDLAWLIEQIKEWLLLEKRRKAFNTYVKNLYLQAQANNEIEVFNVLPQN